MLLQVCPPPAAQRLPGRTGVSTRPGLRPGRWRTSPRTGSHSWLFLLPDLQDPRRARRRSPSGAWRHDPARTCAGKPVSDCAALRRLVAAAGELTAVWSRSPRRFQRFLTWSQRKSQVVLTEEKRFGPETQTFTFVSEHLTLGPSGKRFLLWAAGGAAGRLLLLFWHVEPEETSLFWKILHPGFTTECWVCVRE